MSKNNTGDGNTGENNSGNRNSGNGNSGNGNSGNWNSGNGNSGNGNSTNQESGIFNSEEATVRMFNKPTDKKWDDISHPHFDEFHLTKWIDEDDMTEEEKKNYPDFYVWPGTQAKGYLKSFTYKEAWANFWKDTDEKNRQKFLALPNFDSAVFKEITGIEIDSQETILTMEEVAKLAGVDVKNLKIKK